MATDHPFDCTPDGSAAWLARLEALEDRGEFDFELCGDAASLLAIGLSLDSAVSVWIEDFIDICGGLDAAGALHAEPWVVEPSFPESTCVVRELRPASRLAEREEARVAEVLELAEEYCAEALDPEYTLIVGRLVARMSQHPERPLAGHRSRPERLAAAVVWVALEANGALGRTRNTSATALWRGFGVSTCAAIGRSLAASMGWIALDEQPRSPLLWHTEVLVDDVRLLHSCRRLELLEHRLLLQQLVTQELLGREPDRSVTNVGEGRYELTTYPAECHGVCKVMDQEGRLHVVLAFSDAADELRLVQVSVPDARVLSGELEQALAAPIDAVPRLSYRPPRPHDMWE